MKLRLHFCTKFILICFGLFVGTISAQQHETIYQLNYNFSNSPEEYNVLISRSVKLDEKELMFYLIEIEGEVLIEEVQVKTSELNAKELTSIRDFSSEIPNELFWKSDISVQRKEAKTLVCIYPFLNVQGKVLKIEEVALSLKNSSKKIRSAANRGLTAATNSVLSSGEIHKLSVHKDGVYEITYEMIKKFGLNPSSIDPNLIQVYGVPGGMIDHRNNSNHYDDLIEIPVKLISDGDNTFESGEKVLFYGQSAHQWYLTDEGDYKYSRHLYADSTFYFIKVGDGVSKKVNNESSVLTADTTVEFMDELMIHENDWVNLIKTGRRWVGESFEFEQNQSFSFNGNDVDPSFAPEMTLVAVARATSGNNSFQVRVNGDTKTNLTVPLVSGVYYSDYVKSSSMVYELEPSNSFIVNLEYSKPQSNSLAWLDYITIHSKTKKSVSSSHTLVHLNEGYNKTVNFTLQGSVQNVWDVTDIENVTNKSLTELSQETSFTGFQDTLRRYIAFNNVYLTPSYSGRVINQNLHSLSDIDYIIVTNELLIDQAYRLANHHISMGLTVKVLTQQQIFNEFSGGTKDVMAIRKFLKMLYDRAVLESELPDYLLLFGDGSYDPKNRISNNTDQVICYQSLNSFEPTQSYVSDDFFVLLDDNEGDWSSFSETIDMGVGRFPVNTIAEAQVLVDKSISYSQPTSLNMGDWRNEVVFIADDEDGNTHVYQSNYLSDQVKDLYPNINSKKIFFDAYQQESGAGGDLYPDVNDAINQTFQNGALIVNYTGHGGEVGWAHERVLGFSDIELWENIDKLPLVMTATCEFSRYDDPALVSAGERVLLSEKGGCIAMFTTVRLVFSSPNFVLNQHFYESLIDTSGQTRKRFGDIYMQTKRLSGGATNHRNFTLLGDPALVLVYPERKVRTTSINGFDLGVNDTLKSLAIVEIHGEVLDENDLVDQSFSGVLVPTIFDKPSSINTLANDGGDSFNFNTQENIIFKGNVSVENGQFSFKFMVPKDISFNEGYGKISYYVSDQIVDGAGSYDSIVISGTSDSVSVDNVGPEIVIKMNDDQFIDGGLTNESPLLRVFLSDSSGINTVGNGIGHDIVAIIDEESSNAIVLNDFYESDLDSYQSGQISYQLFNLTEGEHTLKIKAWDVQNNSSERSISFTVRNEESLVISNVFNYPNPFTSNTSFYFDHNQLNEELDVQIQIMTVSGKLIKTLNNSFTTNSFKGEQTSWDGLDDFGDALARGVYVYKLTVSNSVGEKVTQIEKLVVLK